MNITVHRITDQQPQEIDSDRVCQIWDTNPELLDVKLFLTITRLDLATESGSIVMFTDHSLLHVTEVYDEMCELLGDAGWFDDDKYMTICPICTTTRQSVLGERSSN